MLRFAALFTLALTGLSLAQETSSVPLPMERPADLSSVAAASSASSAEPAQPTGPTVPLPRRRPGQISAAGDLAKPKPGETIVTTPIEPKIYQVACPSVMSGQVSAKVLPPIHEGQCGIQSPLSLDAVSANGRSIPLNASVITDCGMATALPAWIEELDSYVFAHDKTRIAEINVSTNYACRNVDNAKTGNLSFHAFADALDIMGFKLKDGRTISISPGFNGTPEQGRDVLHFARDAACTHFMTVLGPDADSFHQDNMHLDLACHGKMCTARLCE
jgi:hypothetical protein